MLYVCVLKGHFIHGGGKIIVFWHVLLSFCWEHVWQQRIRGEACGSMLEALSWLWVGAGIWSGGSAQGHLGLVVPGMAVVMREVWGQPGDRVGGWGLRLRTRKAEDTDTMELWWHSMVCIGLQQDLVRSREYLLWVALCSHKGREN